MHPLNQKHIFVTVSIPLLLAAALFCGQAAHAQRQNGEALRKSLLSHSHDDTTSPAPPRIEKTAYDENMSESGDSTVIDTSLATDAPPNVTNGVSEEEEGYTREEKLRRYYEHPLYDSMQPDESMKQYLDYPPMWTRQLPKNAASDLRKQKQFNYEIKVKPPSSGFFSFLAMYAWVLSKLMWMLLFTVLAFAVYFVLKNNNIQLFSRRKTVVDKEGPTLEAVKSTDYLQLLQQAIAAGNWPAGVRYLYLHTLQQLQQKGMIQMGPDKTNRDYLRDLTNTRWYKNFAILTLDYEYICYGNFDISEQQFEMIRQQFTAFKNELGQS